MIKNLSSRLRISLILFTIASFFIYVPINRSVSGGYNLEIFIDKIIPTIPIFVVPYILAFVFWWGSVIYINLKRTRNQAVTFDLKMLAAGIFSSLIYLIIPTFVSRVVITGNDIFSNMIKDIYANDRTYSAAPSGHTFYTLICLITLNTLVPKYKKLWITISVLIILSTFFIKQHNVLDAVIGAIFALVISIGIDRIVNSKLKE